MEQTRRRFLLVFACLLCPKPHDAFVLRKRSVSDLDRVPSLPQSRYFDRTAVSEEQLADALRVIQLARHQNQLDEDSEDDEGQEEDELTPTRNPYYQTPDEYRGSQEVGEHYLEDEDADFEEEPSDDLVDTWKLEDVVGGDDNSDLENIQQIISSAATEEADAAKQAVNKSDLENLFSSAKDSSSADTGKAPSSAENALGVDKKAELSKTDVAKLLDETGDEDIRDILEKEADKIEAKETSLEGAPGAPKVEVTKVVSVEDGDKSKGDGEDGKQEKATMDVQAVESWPSKNEMVSKEWLIDLVEPKDDKQSENGRSRKLFKRSEPLPLQIMKTIDDEMIEEENKKGEAVELLKAYIELQDEENKHLATALNLATMSQVERTDRYIPEQIDQLKMAVHDEQAMQAIREIIRTGEEAEDAEDEASDGELTTVDFAKRRMDSVSPEETLPQVYDGDYNDGEDGDEGEEDERTELTDAELADRLLKAKLRQYLLETVAVETGDDDRDEQTSLDDLDLSYDYAPGEPVYNPFIRDIVEGRYHQRTPIAKRYSRQDDDDVDDTNLEYRPYTDDTTDLSNLLQGPDEGECPAVAELTTDCLIARDNGLVLDAEATDLCNRHQLCYSCGAIYGLTPERCDGGYLSEAEELCYGDMTCKHEAAGLYLLMIDHHRYVPASYMHTACRAPCTRYYIIGDTTADRRR